MPFYDLLIVSFIFLIFAAYKIGVTLKKISDAEVKKGFKSGFYSLIAGLTIQLLVSIAFLVACKLFDVKW